MTGKIWTCTQTTGKQQHCQDKDEDAKGMLELLNQWFVLSLLPPISLFYPQTTMMLHETAQCTIRHSSSFEKPGHQIIVLCRPPSLMSHTSLSWCKTAWALTLYTQWLKNHNPPDVPVLVRKNKAFCEAESSDRMLVVHQKWWHKDLYIAEFKM